MWKRQVERDNLIEMIETSASDQREVDGDTGDKEKSVEIYVKKVIG